MFVEFTVSQTMEHFLACHEHAFAACGGVPSKIMVDNLKSAVLQRLAGAAPVFNPRYLDFARHHGFAIEACNVARGNEKGRVESGVGYVRNPDHCNSPVATTCSTSTSLPRRRCSRCTIPTPRNHGDKKCIAL
jgi:transposase